MARCPECEYEYAAGEQQPLRCPQCDAALPAYKDQSEDQSQPGAASDEMATVELPGPGTAEPEHSEGSIELELLGGSKTFSGAVDQTIDLPAPAPSGDAPPEPHPRTRTIAGKSDTTYDPDLPPAEPAADAGGSGGQAKGKTHEIKKDLTIYFGAGGAPDADLAARMTGEWGASVAEGGHTGQTFRGSEGDSGSKVGRKTHLPVKSRSVRERTDSPIAEPLAPSDAPDYELLNRIGEGGMGVVYAAHQSSIARTVAIKMLKSGSRVTEEQREKFLSEAVVTGELDHPNIVPIYELGANDSGALFYSMKRVKGTPWDDVIADKTLGENLGVLMRVADAVAFAHAGGVVHRDLKPENVMLGEYGEVLVMDWGLARVTEVFGNRDRVYQADSLGGTPAYMSPEMARGPVELIDETSDVYLLGAILYEIVTGSPPHTGNDVMQCLMAAAQNKITPPTDKSVESRAELIEIALRAMATEQKERYPTVKEFQAAVRVYESHSESLVLSANAAQRLEEAQAAGDYALFANALFGFEEALALWPENEQAQRMRRATQLSYARAALANEDFDLGISLLEGPETADDQDKTDLLHQLEQGRAERDARQRRLRNAKRLAGALVALVIAVTTVSSVVVYRQYQVAVAAREDAVVAQKDAEDQRDIAEGERQKAVVAEQQAVAAKEDAEEQRDNANQQKKIAEAEKERADNARDEAVEQRNIAEDLKRKEEYESYIAKIGLAASKIEENAFDAARTLLEQCQPAALRNWEWGRLAHVCQLSNQTFTYAGPVDAVAFSPDGARIVTGDHAGRAVVRDVETGEELLTLEHGQYVHAATYSPDGRTIATGSSDGRIRMVDAESGELLKTLPGHADGVVSVAFSPDGRRLLSGGYDNIVRLWDAPSGKELDRAQNHTWWVWTVQFSPAGNEAISGGQDKRVIVWQLNDDRSQLTQKTVFDEHDGPVYDAAYSPDGQRVASAGYDGSVRIWSPARVQPVSVADRLDAEPDAPSPHLIVGDQSTRHSQPVQAVAFAPDGRTVLSGSNDNSLRLWDATTGEALKQLRGHGSRVTACAYSPDGARAASGSQDERVRIWDIQSYAERRVLQGLTLEAHSDAILSARFSPDGKRIITGSRDRSAALWNVADGQRVSTFREGHEFLASTAEVFAGGRRLATAAGDGTVRLWDFTAGTEYATLKPTGRTAALAVAPGGDWLVTGGGGDRAVVWNSLSGEQVALLAGHDAEVTAAAISPAGDQIATGDDRGSILLWQRTGAGVASEPRKLQGHSRSITGLAFNGDGRLISASGDKTVGQWDLATGKEDRQRVLRHPDWVASLDLSADGRFALTSCDDGVTRLWRLADARVVAEAEAPGAIYTSVDLSPTGERALLTSAGDRTVRSWNLTSAVAGNGAAAAPEVLLGRDDIGGIVWASRFAGGDAVVTVGGNDAQLWTVDASQDKAEDRRTPVMKFSPHGAVASAAVSASGQLVATGSWDQSIKIWQAESGQAVAKIESAHDGPVNSVVFAPGSDAELLSASDDGTAAIWNLAEADSPVMVLGGHKGRIEQASYSHDGATLLTVSSDKTARLWDRATGQLHKTLSGHAWGLLCGDIAPDGSRVVTGGEDNVAIVWEAATGEAAVTLAGHTAPITSVAFSPDGARVLTGSQDGAAKLWDARTGKEILTLDGHDKEVTSVSFSPDGLQALTAGRDGVALLWVARPWIESPPTALVARP